MSVVVTRLECCGGIANFLLRDGRRSEYARRVFETQRRFPGPIVASTAIGSVRRFATPRTTSAQMRFDDERSPPARVSHPWSSYRAIEATRMAMLAARFPHLKAYLSASTRAPDALNFEQLLGFLYAVSSAPEPVDTREWLRFVFDDAGQACGDAERAVAEAMDLYHDINCQVFECKVRLPADCTPRPDALANLDPDCGLSRWAQGFSVGHEWLEGAWESSVREDRDEDIDWQLGGCMAVLCFFSSREMAQALHEEFHTDARSLEERARVMLDLLPAALNAYADIGRCLATGVAVGDDDAEEDTANDSQWSVCTCGSGRPGRLCCGASRHLH